MKTRKELIEKRDKIQKQIDNFKEETFKNGWYIHKNAEHPKWMMYYDFEKSIGYGFNTSGEWVNNFYNNYGYIKSDCLLQNDKEAEQALIKEAKKKGFKKGVETVCINVPNECEKILNNSSFRLAGDNRLLVDSNGAAGWVCIFQDGKWAEIIEDKKPTIDGCEIEVSGENVKFGCLDFKKTYIFRLHKEIELFNTQNENSQITSFIIDSRQIEIEELKEVVDYLNK